MLLTGLPSLLARACERRQSSLTYATCSMPSRLIGLKAGADDLAGRGLGWMCVCVVCLHACVDDKHQQKGEIQVKVGVIKEGADDLRFSLFLCLLYLQDWVAAVYPMAACAAPGRMKDPVTQGAAVKM